jgi:hypothetical protein
MEREKKRFLYTLIVITGLFLIQACDTDPASPEIGDAPEIPLFQNVEIDNSYFQENSPSGEEMEQNPGAYDPFLTARNMVSILKDRFDETLELPRFFLLVTSTREAAFQDGNWVWNFPFTVDGELIDEEEDFDVDVFVTARVNENANTVNWEFLVSGTGTPFGDLDDFKIFEAETSLDNSAGELQFFSPDNPEIPVLDLEWDINSPTDKTFSATLIVDDNEENNNSVSITIIGYFEEVPDFSLSFSDGSDSTIEVTWNTDTLSGSIATAEETCFWGEDLAETECN